jgi:hypothetical protein
MRSFNLLRLNYLCKFLPFILFAVLSLFIVRNLIVTDGGIGLRHDWPTTPFSGQLQQASVEHFFAWSTRSLGTRYNVYGLPFVNLLLNFPSFFGLTGFILSKLILIITLVLSGISAWYLAKTLRFKNAACLLSGLFYMLTPLLFVKIVSGYINYLIGYAFQPLILAFFVKSVQSDKINYKSAMIAGILYAFSWYQPQFLLMAGFWLASWTLLSVRTLSFKFYLKSLIVVLIVSVLINITVLSSLIYTFAIGPGIGPTTDYWTVYATPGSLFSTLRLVESIFGYFDNALANSLNNQYIWQLASVLILLIIFSPLLLPSDATKRKLALYFTIVAILTIIVGNGAGAPFGNVYLFLLNSIPIFQAFREPSHILAMTCLAYSVLLGIFVDILFHKLNKIRFRRLLLPINFVAGLLVFVVISVYAYPFFTGDFGGNVQTYNISPSYKNLYDYLAADPTQYRVLWVPMSQPISYGTKYSGLDPMLIYSPKPTLPHGLPATGIQGPYTTFVASTIHENRTSYLGSLLSLASIKYIINRRDVTTNIENFAPILDYDQKTYEAYLNENVNVGSLLEGQKDIIPNPVLSSDNFSVYENPSYLPRVYASDNIVLIVGDLSTLVSLSYTQAFERINENNPVFVFSSQLTSKELTLLLPYIKTIVFDDNNVEELAFTYIPEQEKVLVGNLASFANTTENPFFRWSSLDYNWWWHNWQSLASLDYPAITKYPATLSVPLKVQKNATYELWAKAYISSRASQLSFILDNELISVLSTFSKTEEGFKWICISDNLTLTQGDYKLKISGSYGEEVLAKIALTEKGTVETCISQIEDSIKQKEIVNLIEVEKLAENLNIVLDSSFEANQKTDDIIIRPTASSLWSQPRPAFNTQMDNTTCWSGNQSLKVYTSAFSNFTWSWIKGNATLVNEQETYEIVTHMKYENVRQSHIAIEGYNSSSQLWVQLAQVPGGLDGGSDWREFSFTLTIPRGISAIRPVLNAGWVNNIQKGEAITWFDDIIIRPKPELQTDASAGGFLAIRSPYQLEIPIQLLNIKNWTFSFRYRALDSLDIFAGEQKYIATPQNDFSWINVSLSSSTVRIQTSSADLDVAYTYSPGNQTRSDQLSAVFNMLSPTNYEVQISNATSPFILVFTDAYDSGWEAHIKGDDNNFVSHFIANSYSNAWFINRTESFTINLEYAPQKVYDFGSKVSFLTIGIVVALVLIPSRILAKLRQFLRERYSSLSRYH